MMNKMRFGYIVIKQTKTQQRGIARSNNNLLTLTDNITRCLILSNEDKALDILNEFVIWDKERNDYQPRGYFVIQKIYYDPDGQDT